MVTINKKCIKILILLVTKSDIVQCKKNGIYEKVPLCLRFADVDAYFVEENENEYLVLVLTENNKKMLELYKRLWTKIKKQIKAINSGESIKYRNVFMKIRVYSNDVLPLNKILDIPVTIMT